MNAHCQERPEIAPYKSEYCEKYLINLWVDNSCINIVGDSPEECLREIATCGKSAILAIDELGISSPNPVGILFKCISRIVLQEAIQTKSPHDTIDIFAILNLDTNEIHSFSTGSCLAGYLQSVTLDLYPSGIITLHNNDFNMRYRTRGEAAYIKLRSALGKPPLELWSGLNPVHSPHWPVNIQLILSPSYINREAIHNWIGGRVNKLRLPTHSRLGYTITLGPVSRSHRDKPTLEAQKVIILTKNEGLSREKLAELILIHPPYRIITLSPAAINFISQHKLFRNHDASQWKESSSRNPLEKFVQFFKKEY